MTTDRYGLRLIACQDCDCGQPMTMIVHLDPPQKLAVAVFRHEAVMMAYEICDALNEAVAAPRPKAATLQRAVAFGRATRRPHLRLVKGKP